MFLLLGICVIVASIAITVALRPIPGKPVSGPRWGGEAIALLGTSGIALGIAMIIISLGF